MTRQSAILGVRVVIHFFSKFSKYFYTNSFPTFFYARNHQPGNYFMDLLILQKLKTVFGASAYIAQSFLRI